MIRALPTFLILCLGMAPASAFAVPRLDVQFVDPANYTDASLRDYRGVCEYVCRELKAHMEKLTAKYLTDEQHLHVEVIDVDLAGRFEPWRVHAYGVRFLRHFTWPRIDLRYTLTERGRTVARGEEVVSDLGYQMRSRLRLDSDRLRSEKLLLDDWFRKRFAEKHASRG